MRGKAVGRRGKWHGGGVVDVPQEPAQPPSFAPPPPILSDNTNPMDYYQQGIPTEDSSMGDNDSEMQTDDQPTERKKRPWEKPGGQQPYGRKLQCVENSGSNARFGQKMMQKMGWSPGEGLGKNHEGTLEPLQINVKLDKIGLQSREEWKQRKFKPRFNTAGEKIKRKKVPGAKNLRIRKYVQPKNAVMCLNELRPGVSYTTEQDGGVGQPFCISVEIDSQKFRGYGSNKQLAKQAAAEAALISFVKPPVVGQSANPPEEDKTPWATLASFAIYKLFNDWREGRVGMCPPPAQPYASAIPPAAGLQAFLGQAGGGAVAAAVAGAGSGDELSQAAAFTEAITAHLGGRASVPGSDVKVESNAASLASTEPAKVPNPAKQVPENASGMHPVMVLHQMRPGLQYTISQSNRDGKPFFSVSTDIDGKNFIGEGVNVKKAKLTLAKDAIKTLFEVDSTFVPQPGKGE